jgi:hypothetical protein
LRASKRGLLVLQQGHKLGAPSPVVAGEFYDRAGNFLRSFKLDLITEALEYGAYWTGWDSAVSKSGQYLALQPIWQDGYGHPSVRSSVVYVVDLDTGSVFRKLTYTDRPAAVTFLEEELLVKFGRGWSRYPKLDGDAVFDTEHGNETVIALDAGRELVYRVGGNLFVMKDHKISQFLDAGDQVNGTNVGYFPKLALLVAVVDGVLQVRGADDLATKFNFRIRGAGEWIAYQGDGHFVASPLGTDGLSWNVGEDYLPFESLRERFEVRNLVARALKEASAPTPSGSNDGNPAKPQTVLNSKNKLTIEPDVFLPPYRLSILGDGQRSTVRDSEPVAIVVMRTRATQESYALEITLNGRVMVDSGDGVPVVRALDCPSESIKDCAGSHQFMAVLQPGLNVVTVTLVYRQVRVEPQTIAIQRSDAAGTRAAVDVAKLPRLLFFGVGVSTYADATLSLKYPHADALSLAEAFRSQEHRLFSEVKVKTLINEQANAESVRLELNRFVRSATEQDVVVVFLAGHGVLDETNTLYFLTYDAKPDEPFTGIDMGVVHDILSKRPPRQKAIVMLDICHAGAMGATRGVTVGASDDAIRQLSTGAGIKVMTASTAKELSQESAGFGGGHGAFSWAVVEGLRGGAADGSFVTVMSLERYVALRVQTITGNHQHPTSSAEKFQDYPLAMAQ